MNQKLVISKPGYNALTETDVDNFIFNSDYDTLKYYATAYSHLQLPVVGQFAGNDYTVGPGETRSITYSIKHNLGYYPVFDVYINSPELNADKWYPNNFRSISGEGFVFAWATTNEIIMVHRVYNPTEVSYYDTEGFNVAVKIFRNDTEL